MQWSADIRADRFKEDLREALDRIGGDFDKLTDDELKAFTDQCPLFRLTLAPPLFD